MIGSAGYGEGGAREGRGRAPLRPGAGVRAADQAAGAGDGGPGPGARVPDAGVRQLPEDGAGQRGAARGHGQAAGAAGAGARQAARRAEDRAAAALTEAARREEPGAGAAQVRIFLCS